MQLSLYRPGPSGNGLASSLLHVDANEGHFLRKHTVFVYLTDVREGGELAFPCAEDPAPCAEDPRLGEMAAAREMVLTTEGPLLGTVQELCRGERPGLKVHFSLELYFR